MNFDQIFLEGGCGRCGGSAFSLPDYATDDAWIFCDNCSQLLVRLETYKARVAGANRQREAAPGNDDSSAPAATADQACDQHLTASLPVDRIDVN